MVKIAVIHSVSISNEFEQFVKKYHLSCSRATAIGISILLGDLGVQEYDNKLNIYRKMRVYQEKVTQLSAEIDQIKQRVGEKNVF